MSALALISTLASISSSPITLLSMIPLLAVGLNYYRYTNVDPESAPIDAPVVSYCIITAFAKKTKANFLSFYFFFSLTVKEALRFHSSGSR